MKITKTVNCTHETNRATNDEQINKYKAFTTAKAQAVRPRISSISVRASLIRLIRRLTISGAFLTSRHAARLIPFDGE